MTEPAAFGVTEPRPTNVRGVTRSGPITADDANAIEILGGLFRGAIRQLAFDPSGSLLVLSGRGVIKLDPKTLDEQDRWLPSLHVQALFACGERLWVVAEDSVYLAAFGGELGPALTTVVHHLMHRYAAAGMKLAVLTARGARVIDAQTGVIRDYRCDEAWFEGTRPKQGPDRAMLSPSGRYVGVCKDFAGYTVIWECETGERVLERMGTESHALIDDRRILKGDTQLDTRTSVIDITTGESSSPPEIPRFADVLATGDRMLLGDTLGGFNLLEVETLKVLATLDGVADGHPRHSQDVRFAFSDTHVASYAVTPGLLRLTEIGGSTVESADWSGGADSLSVGGRGRRAGIFRRWGEGRLECVDLDAATLVELRGPGGEEITKSGITADGQRVIVPTGSIIRARTVFVGDFAAAPAKKSHAIKSCVQELVNYGDDLYAISTYTQRKGGHVGLHRASSARAIGKVVLNKEQPWRVAVGNDEDELLVAWETATILYDITKRPKDIATFPKRANAVALGPRGYLAYLEGGELVLRTPLSRRSHW